MKTKITLIGLVVLVLGLAGFGGFYYLKSQKQLTQIQQDAQLQLAFFAEYGQSGQFAGSDKVGDARIVSRISNNQTALSFYVFDKRIGYKFVELGVLSK